MKSVRKVAVFVDFNSLLKVCPIEFVDLPEERCGHTLRQIGKNIVRTLRQIDDDCVFRVRLRLYHGWTTGVSPTKNRVAVSRLPEFEEPDTLFPSASVLAMTDIEFGDKLIEAPEARENRGLGIHLPDTARRQRKGEPLTEKMVDTALASDLLTWAKLEPSSVVFVYSSDDDVIPPIFVAESWMQPEGGLIKLFSRRDRSPNKYLRLEGLLGIRYD